jgi:hypothetical protein
MKDILKMVYGDQKEVKLESQVFEFGLIDDIKSSMKEANRGAMKAIDLANDAKKPAEESLKLNKALLNKIDVVIKKAKELGINEVVSDLNKKRQQVEINIKEIDSILNALYKI